MIVRMIMCDLKMNRLKEKSTDITRSPKRAYSDKNLRQSAIQESSAHTLYSNLLSFLCVPVEPLPTIFFKYQIIFRSRLRPRRRDTANPLSAPQTLHTSLQLFLSTRPETPLKRIKPLRFHRYIPRSCSVSCSITFPAL